MYTGLRATLPNLFKKSIRLFCAFLAVLYFGYGRRIAAPLIPFFSGLSHDTCRHLITLFYGILATIFYHLLNYYLIKTTETSKVSIGVCSFFLSTVIFDFLPIDLHSPPSIPDYDLIFILTFIIYYITLKVLQCFGQFLKT